jgi:subtilase family serine protease
MPAAQRLNLAICLPVRDPNGLNHLLKDLYDPASTSYHQYLTPQQFSERFGASESDYAAVMAFARSNGLNITATHQTRLILDVNATAAAIEKAFHLTLRVYNHPTESRTFFAPGGEPSVEGGLSIMHISGLDNYSLPHPNYRLKSPDVTSKAKPRNGSAPGGDYQGSDFRTAYVPGTTLTGAGQSVGLLEFDGY